MVSFPISFADLLLNGSSGVHFSSSLDKLPQPLLHSCTSIKSIPNSVGSLVNDVPRNEVVGQSGKILLLALPLGIALNLDSRTDNRKRHISVLNSTCRHDFALGETVCNKVLLELGLDEFSGLVRVATVDAVFAGATLEQGACETDGAERGDDAPGPENEAAARAADAVEEVLVVGVDEEHATDLLHVAGAEDAGDDASCSC
jgi:hypothetical protein